MKTLIVNHLLDTINKEIDADWWAEYLDLLFQLAEERAKQSSEGTEDTAGSDSTEESVSELSESVDDSMKPLIRDLNSIFDNMNNQILENNNKVLNDIMSAVAQGMDREALEEIIESLPKVSVAGNTFNRLDREDSGEMRESLPKVSKAGNTFTDTDREDSGEITESLPKVTEAANTLKDMDRNIVETLRETLPEDHTLPSPETVKVLKAAQENHEKSGNV
ncbi:hypothetical protein MOC05_05240 [Bacillus sonorensis]|uniref:hypothetical protein n=1 Tax=Bacillus sonorensis TaxID=119858 RepID=UPI002280A46C|nr:hypothetical protein [Bacillus sonorensis]MCY8024560.1 hypothetical protein [Bacillus sonorensis]